MNKNYILSKLNKYNLKLKNYPNNVLYQEKYNKYIKMIGGTDKYIEIPNELMIYFNLRCIDVPDKNINIFYLDKEKIKNYIITNDIDKNNSDYKYFSSKNIKIDEIIEKFYMTKEIINENTINDELECIKNFFNLKNIAPFNCVRNKNINLYDILSNALNHINNIIKCKEKKSKIICNQLNINNIIENIILLMKIELLDETKLCNNFLYAYILGFDLIKDPFKYSIQHMFCKYLIYNIFKFINTRYDTSENIFKLQKDEVYFFSYALTNILFTYFEGNLEKVLYIALSIGTGIENNQQLFVERFSNMNPSPPIIFGLLDTVYINSPIKLLDKKFYNYIEKDKKQKNKIIDSKIKNNKQYIRLKNNIKILSEKLEKNNNDMNNNYQILIENYNNRESDIEKYNESLKNHKKNEYNKNNIQILINEITGKIELIIKSKEELSYDINFNYENIINTIFEKTEMKKWNNWDIILKISFDSTFNKNNESYV